MSIFFGVCPCMLIRYLSAYIEIDNHNKICQYDLTIDKYFLTYIGYIILATAVMFGMGITDGNLLLYNGNLEQIKDNKILMREYNIRAIYD